MCMVVDIGDDSVSIKKILVPIDGSETSFKAANYAIYLAKMVNAELVPINIMEDVKLKVVLLEVGMAEIALMFVQSCSLRALILRAHTSASTSTTTSYPCLFAML